MKILNSVLLNKYTSETLELHILIIKIQMSYDFKCFKCIHYIYLKYKKNTKNHDHISSMNLFSMYIIGYISNWQVSHIFPGI